VDFTLRDAHFMKVANQGASLARRRRRLDLPCGNVSRLHLCGGRDANDGARAFRKSL